MIKQEKIISNKNELINYYAALFIKAYDGALPCDLSGLTEEELQEAIEELENHLSDEK